MVEADPGAQIEEGRECHAEELDGHGGLGDFEFGYVDESEGGGEGDVVEGPVEAEDGVEDDADQPAELVLAVAVDQLQGFVVLDDELAEPHELPGPLEVDCVERRVLAMR